MSKLVISGYEKLKELRINDWVCSIVRETDEVYSFLFDYKPIDLKTEHQDFFNLITICRRYSNLDGYKISVDFNIVRHDGFVEEFKNVKTKYIYAHNLITPNTFKKVLEPLLVLNA